MSIISKTKSFFNSRENIAMIILGILISIDSFFYLSQKMQTLGIPHLPIDANVFLFFFFILGILFIGTVFFYNASIGSAMFLQRFLLVYLLSEIIFIYGLQKLVNLNSLIGPATAVYFLALIVFIWQRETEHSKENKNNSRKNFSFVGSWPVGILIMGVVVINLFFGIYHLGKMAIVDEPLWTYDRIPNFWKYISEGNWYKSRVSDKPGFTIALISGPSLLFEKNPLQYKNAYQKEGEKNKTAGELDHFNFAFRLPTYLFSVLALPLFYFFIKKLTNPRIALFSFTFIGLSPILLGNSRIINPDGLLWIFTSFSLFSYLIYFKKDSFKYLFLSALFLSLAVLTKYTANILLIFFFLYIFVEYIFNYEKYSNQLLRNYLKKHLLDYGKLAAITLAIFYVFYPAVWEKPSRVFLGTIFSQPFEPIWPIFFTIIAVVAADFITLKSLAISFIAEKLARIRNYFVYIILALLLASVVLVFINIYSEMKFFDFNSMLASPKSSYESHDIPGLFLANFYPLFFGISPLAAIVIIFYILKILTKKSFQEENVKIALTIIIFIFMYYGGAVFSEVSSTVRYQIILFPFILLLAGISLNDILSSLKLKKPEWFFNQPGILNYAAVVFLIFILSWELFRIKPFYMSYSSPLLPKKYYIDVKDMGDGSYEAAQYLNSLPDAKNLKIWTDKKGVCTFFVGKCFTIIDSAFFNETPLDYFILSSGRMSRTVNMTDYRNRLKLDFSKMYETENSVYKIEIGGRLNNFVKIVNPLEGLK